MPAAPVPPPVASQAQPPVAASPVVPAVPVAPAPAAPVVAAPAAPVVLAPAAPVDPVVPAVPVPPLVPAVPEVPTVPAAPDVPVVPAAPVVPAPAAPEVPAVPLVPVVPALPLPPVVPAVPLVPAVPVVPAVPLVPAVPVVPPVPVVVAPYSYAPRSGALPTYGSMTSTPLSMRGLPALRCRKVQADGMLPSASRGPVQPVSDVLAKSALVSLMLRSQVLLAVSTPVMFAFLLGKPTLFRMMWTLLPDNVMVPVTFPDESKLLASMLYCVPFMYDVLLYQVLPPVEWLA